MRPDGGSRGFPPPSGPGPEQGAIRFQRDLDESRRVEARLPWKQLVASALVAVVVAARYLWFA